MIDWWKIRLPDENCIHGIKLGESPEGAWYQHGDNPEHVLFIPREEMNNNISEVLVKLVNFIEGCHARESHD